VLAKLGLDGHPIVWTGEAPERSTDLPDSLPGTRGGHVYFRGDLATGKVAHLPGVEVRGAGAYVVAPPSAHSSGVPYEGELAPVAELPDARSVGLDLLAPAAASVPVLADDAQLASGERHEGLLAWARSRLTAKGTLSGVSLDAMLGHNQRTCKPPLPV
jgi:hypothetical protein